MLAQPPLLWAAATGAVERGVVMAVARAAVDRVAATAEAGSVETAAV